MKRYFSGGVSFLCSVIGLAFANGVYGSLITYSEGGDATVASIQDTVDKFRVALGDPNNGNAAGPLASGRREINWDGGGAATTVSPTPFTGFLNNRGALFTTPGTGFIQAPPSGFPTDLSSTFGVFSQQRLFSAIDSNITEMTFFIPGTNGLLPATVSGFGAVFTDVDLYGSTSIQFYDFANNLIFDKHVPGGRLSPKKACLLGSDRGCRRRDLPRADYQRQRAESVDRGRSRKGS